MDIKIIVATHKKALMPTDGCYLPLHVGREGKPDLGYTCDNTGDNISARNPSFCELTGVYWAWKNLKADYVGLVHYRRYLSCRRKPWKFEEIMSTQDFEAKLQKADVIMPPKRYYVIETIRSHYCHTHDIMHLEVTREVMKGLTPEYIEAFDNIMDRRSCHMFNMFVMKRELFDAYCAWLFPLLFAIDERVDSSAMSPFDTRWVGRVAEMLLDVWLLHNNVKYVEVGMTQLGDVHYFQKVRAFLAAKFLGIKYDRSR